MIPLDFMIVYIRHDGSSYVDYHYRDLLGAERLVSKCFNFRKKYNGYMTHLGMKGTEWVKTISTIHIRDLNTGKLISVRGVSERGILTKWREPQEGEGE